MTKREEIDIQLAGRQAHTLTADFVHWYNLGPHSGIHYVSPAQCHAGNDHAVLRDESNDHCRHNELPPKFRLPRVT